jgi:hypothetical protein
MAGAQRGSSSCQAGAQKARVDCPGDMPAVVRQCVNTKAVTVRPWGLTTLQAQEQPSVRQRVCALHRLSCWCNQLMKPLADMLVCLDVYRHLGGLHLHALNFLSVLLCTRCGSFNSSRIHGQLASSVPFSATLQRHDQQTMPGTRHMYRGYCYKTAPAASAPYSLLSKHTCMCPTTSRTHAQLSPRRDAQQSMCTANMAHTHQHCWFET